MNSPGVVKMGSEAFVSRSIYERRGGDVVQINEKEL
jgi:hypothetical protein